jgi:hypothetical protein
MAPAAYVTLFIGVLIVGATAASLVKIIGSLIHVRATLGTIVVGVLVIDNQTDPVGPALDSVNASLKPVRDFCESI